MPSEDGSANNGVAQSLQRQGRDGPRTGQERPERSNRIRGINGTTLVAESNRLMKINLSVANALDRKRLAQIADWAAVGVAVSLPWSTSLTSILLVVWVLTLLPTFDVAMVGREVETAAGGLPVLLWLLAAVGMLWPRSAGRNAFTALVDFTVC
jgi:hypothetical protein